MIKLRQLWQDVRASLWFLPGILVLSAVALAIGMIVLDDRFGAGTFDRWPRLFGSTASGARQLLATVASSMITVAGVVFSITIVALSLASSQYTPRVLRNFMGNRVNQSVLGVFVGIFAYCLVVLRTIRGGEDTYVPSLAVAFGLLLAFVGIAVLIYFIHHIAASIQATHILDAVAHETRRAIGECFPERAAQPDDAGAGGPPEAAGDWRPIAASRTGYLQSLDVDGLVAFARERGSVLRMECDIGQFLIAGAPVASERGAPAGREQDSQRIEQFYTVGVQRTIEQDAAFGIRQIVDIALRALSPGINDPTTAIMAVDYLAEILIRLSERRIVCRHRDESGALRVITPGPTYAGIVGDAFDQIRHHGEGQVAVLGCLIVAIARVAAQTASPARRGVLAGQARAVVEAARRSIVAPRDRELFEASLAGAVARHALADDAGAA